MSRFVPNNEDNYVYDKCRSDKHTDREIIANFDPKSQLSYFD